MELLNESLRAMTTDPKVITAWGVFIAGVLAAIVAALKAKSSSDIEEDKNSINNKLVSEEKKVQIDLSVAAGQVEYLIKPLREEIVRYSNKIDNLKEEVSDYKEQTQKLQSEVDRLKDNEKTIEQFVTYVIQLQEVILKEIPELLHKLPIPPERVQAYLGRVK